MVLFCCSEVLTAIKTNYRKNKSVSRFIKIITVNVLSPTKLKLKLH